MNEGRLYKYFLAFLDLSTALCYQRNYKGINAFTNVFPIDIVFGCANSEELPYAVRSRFTKLLLHLHVDKDPLEPIVSTNLTREWGLPDELHEDLMPHRNHIPMTLEVLKKFVQVRDQLLNHLGLPGGLQRVPAQL